MVRRYKRKTDDKYSKETLQESVKAVQEEKMTPTQAALVFGIPRSTIIAHKKGDRGVKSKTHGRPTVFKPDLEKNIASMLHAMERNGFGLSQREVRALVGQYVRRNKIDSPFKDGIPGEEWMRGFKQRNKLSIKKPQGVEIARKKAADPFLVNEFYDLLEVIVEKQKLSGAQIWNMDETSFCQDPGKSKIVGLRGFQATRTISSPGRDNTTVLFASNSLGQKLPPLIIFKGTYLWNSWLPEDDSISAVAYAATSKGWMEASVFESYFSNVLIPEICKTNKPQLVVFDGHSTHLDINVIQKASENNITLLKLPAHTSHILQPLDVSTMKSMKDRWDQRLIKWQRLNIGKKIQKKEFTQILVEIWEDLDPAILRNGFKKTGIYPLDRNQIGDDKLDPSALLRWKKYLAEKNNKTQENDTVHIVMQPLQEREAIAEKQQNQESKAEKTSQVTQQPQKEEPETKMTLPKAKLPEEQDSQAEQSSQKNQQPDDQDLQAKKIILEKQGDTVQKSKPYMLIPKKGCNNSVSLKILSNKLVNYSGNKENVMSATFESLLLETISRGKEEPKIKRKRLGIGAEVITNKDYIEKKKKEKEESSNKKLKIINKKNRNIPLKRTKLIKPNKKQQLPKKRKCAISESETTSESEMMSTHSDSDLDDIYSDIDSGGDGEHLTTQLENKEKLQKVTEVDSDSEREQTYKIIQVGNKECRIKQEKSTTTSTVHAQIHSEPKLRLQATLKKTVDISEENHVCGKQKAKYQITADASEIGVIKTDTEGVEVQKYDDNDLENCIVEKNDTVLVRYYEKKNWKYYVGVIQKVEKNDRYKVNTRDSKKNLKFSMPKIADTDLVPMTQIVKQIELFQISENPCKLVLGNDNDNTYF